MTIDGGEGEMTGKHDDEFAAFATAASPGLLRSAWLICGDASEAEDLVQAAMVKVYVRWGKLRQGHPRAYAHRCILNGHIDAHRRSKRETTVSDLPEEHHHDRDPEDTRSLVRLLATLPTRERQVVVMRHYAGLSEAEVADLLGVSVGTVKSSGSRGLARLRQGLSTHDHKEDEHV